MHHFVKGKWIKIQDAESLMNHPYFELMYDMDKDFIIEVLDFNYTSMTLEMKSDEKYLDKKIPLKFNGKTEKEINFKEKDEKKTVTIPYEIGKDVKFGLGTSTTTVNAVNSKSGDIYSTSSCASGQMVHYYGVSSTLAGMQTAGTGYEYRQFMTMNTSVLEDDAIIESVLLKSEVNNNFLTGSQEISLYACNYGATLTTADFNTALGDYYGTWVNASGLQGVLPTNSISTTSDTQFCGKINIACDSDFATVQLSDLNTFPYLIVNYSIPIYEMNITYPTTSDPITVSDGENFSIIFEYHYPYATVNITENVTVESVYDDDTELNIIQVSPHCSGSPSACSEFNNNGTQCAASNCSHTPSSCDNDGSCASCATEGSCTSCPSCSWNSGACANTGSQSCGAIGGTACCNSVAGCSWWFYFCTGSLSNCNTITDSSCCLDANCAWSPASCSGSLACSDYDDDQTNCEACGQCLWASGICSGTPYSCDNYDNETACDAAGCTWDAGGDDVGWVNGVGWRVNVTGSTGHTGAHDLFVNATYSGYTVNDTQTEAIIHSESGVTFPLNCSAGIILSDMVIDGYFSTFGAGQIWISGIIGNFTKIVLSEGCRLIFEAGKYMYS